MSLLLDNCYNFVTLKVSIVMNDHQTALFNSLFNVISSFEHSCVKKALCQTKSTIATKFQHSYAELETVDDNIFLKLQTCPLYYTVY